jgi:hypothetical protein
MTKEEALKMLEDAPLGDSPSKLNPLLTKTQAVNIVINGIKALKYDVLPDIFEKRVYQVCLNQKRPRI